MSVSTEQAIAAAHASVLQDDPNAELLQLALNRWTWSVVLATMRQAGRFDVADLMEKQLRHPSAQLPTDSDPTPPHGIQRPSDVVYGRFSTLFDDEVQP